MCLEEKDCRNDVTFADRLIEFVYCFINVERLAEGIATDYETESEPIGRMMGLLKYLSDVACSDTPQDVADIVATINSRLFQQSVAGDKALAELETGELARLHSDLKRGMLRDSLTEVAQ